MSDYRFKVGQLVRMIRTFPDRTGSDVYSITRQLPETANGELHYRVKGADNVERAVGETHLRLV